jgi:hypothetical protein
MLDADGGAVHHGKVVATRSDIGAEGDRTTVRLVQGNLPARTSGEYALGGIIRLTGVKDRNLSDEATELLREIRDLLIPIQDHYLAEYTERQAVRLEAKRAKVTDLLSTATRRKAWLLADGTRTQREISKQAALDEGATSKFFKHLRDLGAIEGQNPTRTMEVD